MKKFGINGFGRIGRTSFRVWWQFHRNDLELAVINTSGSMPMASWIHLIKYDSNYGTFNDQIEFTETQSNKDANDQNPVIGKITKIGDQVVNIVFTAQRNPSLIPWGANGVETVIESTGAFLDAEKASGHLQAGATKVIISAPTKGDSIEHSLIGVTQTSANNSQIISNESCTTNCVAPVTAIMEQAFGIEKAMVTTIHSYTDDQNLHDNSHKDLRRARAAGLNIVPTTTGAAVATAKVIPGLDGKFDGLAIRVPTAVGSLCDMVYLVSRNTTIEEINQVFTAAAQQENWRGILAVTNDQIVSSDIVGRRESSIVDLSLTNVIGGNLVKVISWYDNEYGYCNRLVEQVARHL